MPSDGDTNVNSGGSSERTAKALMDLVNEVARLRSALAFYAEPWTQRQTADRGGLARHTLENGP